MVAPVAPVPAALPPAPASAPTTWFPVTAQLEPHFLPSCMLPAALDSGLYKAAFYREYVPSLRIHLTKLPDFLLCDTCSLTLWCVMSYNL